ncbi:NYN domain-containing protein [Arenibacterium sp. LLYu02]|uniref:NYN domain-containing protein n=1 Tax=Arenibacterium sp. LLYu02 TaxID=3404132 RepID=UPI003B2235C5
MVELGFLVFLGVLLAVLLRRRRKAHARRLAIIDGSNLIYWRDEACSLEPVQDAIATLRKAGYLPCVIFDANAGYLVADRYLDGGAFAKRLGLSEQNAHVVPRGQPADPFILQLARESDGIVISRDRFRDWMEAFPQETEPDRVAPGGYRDGVLTLDLDRVQRSKKKRR